MDLTPSAVQKYYLRDDAEYRMPRTYQTMIEVTHRPLPIMAMGFFGAGKKERRTRVRDWKADARS